MTTRKDSAQGADDDIYRRLMPSDGDGPPDPALPGPDPSGDLLAAESLKISPSALRTAGQRTREVGHGTRTARGRLQRAHDNAGRATGGFAFGTALAEVHASWDRRLSLITKDCDEIAGLCSAAARDHEATDKAARDSMTQR
jgi:hypothetical protein